MEPRRSVCSLRPGVVCRCASVRGCLKQRESLFVCGTCPHSLTQPQQRPDSAHSLTQPQQRPDSVYGTCLTHSLSIKKGRIQLIGDVTSYPTSSPARLVAWKAPSLYLVVKPVKLSRLCL